MGLPTKRGSGLSEERFKIILREEGYLEQDVEGLWKQANSHETPPPKDEDALRTVARAMKPVFDKLNETRKLIKKGWSGGKQGTGQQES